jgi:hypothetical protein
MNFEYVQFSHDEWSRCSRPGSLYVNFQLEVMLPVEGETYRGRARKLPMTHSWRGAGRYSLKTEDVEGVFALGEGLLRALAASYPPGTATQSRFHAYWQMRDENGEPINGKPWNSGMHANGLLDHESGEFRQTSFGFEKRDSRINYPNLRDVAASLATRHDDPNRPDLRPLLEAPQDMSQNQHPLPHDLMPEKATARPVAEPAWTIFDTSGALVCKRCGARVALSFPLSIDQMGSEVESFNAQHAGCTTPPRPPLPTHNHAGTPLPDAIKTLSKREFDELPEYTLTLPSYSLESGLVKGRRAFKRNADGHGASPPLWLVCEVSIVVNTETEATGEIVFHWFRADVEEEGV